MLRVSPHLMPFKRQRSYIDSGIALPAISGSAAASSSNYGTRILLISVISSIAHIIPVEFNLIV